MPEQQPDDLMEKLADIIYDNHDEDVDYLRIARAVLASGLVVPAPDVVPRTDDWEWAVATESGFLLEELGGPPTTENRERVDHFDFARIVRRRPAGPWEVAPDA